MRSTLYLLLRVSAAVAFAVGTMTALMPGDPGWG